MILEFSCIDENFDEVVIMIVEKMEGPPDSCTLSAGIAVRSAGEDSFYNRTVQNVNTLTTSPLGIIQLFMDELPEEALKVAEAPVPSTVARRQPTPLRAVQAGVRQLHSD